MRSTLKAFFANLSFKKMSTPPHYESYMWGKHQSIFANFTYRIMFLIRFISPLQLFKAIFRAYQAAIPADKNDTKDRKDFHALHTEIYLLAVFVLAFVQYIGGYLPEPIIILLLIESIGWVFYYMLFRILIEKHLSIFNEAEYFIVLPAVLSTQFLLIASLYTDISFSEVLAVAFDLSVDADNMSDNLKIGLGLLGYIYTTLIIANLINLIPPIPIWRRPNITIIGAGDVVKNRILPALIDSKIYLPSQVAIASDYIDAEFKKELQQKGIACFAVNDERKAVTSFQEREKTRQQVMNYLKKRSSYAIIATPTDEHLAYVTALAKEKIIFAVEKPLIANGAELQVIKEHGEQLMAHGFLLSYYWLEKALPLNYFLTLNPVYREFLDIQCNNDDDYLSPSALAYLHDRLGALEKIEMLFLEENEERQWALTKETGGFYFETFIHPMTLLLNIVGFDKEITYSSESKWYLTESAQNRYPDVTDKLGANFIVVKGHAGSCGFDIKAGKFSGHKKRCATIQYSNGQIDIDLDQLTCDVNLFEQSSKRSLTIQVKEEYAKQKYAIQMTLFDQFIRESGEWTGQRFDDFPEQVQVISQMRSDIHEATTSSFYDPEFLPDIEVSKILQTSE